jgi:hypothetical protein
MAACLAGEPVAAAVSKVILRHAIGSARKRARQNLLRSLMDSGQSSQLPNECANPSAAARNFVNDRQGYRTVNARRSAAGRNGVYSGIDVR